MKALAAILLLLPQLSLAQPSRLCGDKVACPHAPMGPDPDLVKAGILNTVRAVLEAHSDYQKAVQEEAELREQLKRHPDYTRRQAWEERVQDVERHERDAQGKFEDLTNAVQGAYGIRPVLDSGSMHGGPSGSLSTNWKPQLVLQVRDEKGNLVSRYANEVGLPSGGKTHVGVDFSRGNAARGSATTLSDGEVLIPIETLQDALDKGNPNWLAATLFHESVHFTDLASTGWTSYEAIEMAAHDRVSGFAAEFGLTTLQRATIEGNAATMQNKIAAGQVRSAYPYPQEVATAKEWYMQYQGELQAVRDAQATLREKLEQDRQTRQEEERRRREEERRQATRRQLLEDYKSWVKRHGFTPLMTRDGNYAEGFKAPNRCDYSFNRAGYSLEEARMTLFFSQLCLGGGYAESQDNEEILGEVLAIINRNWTDPDFRSKIELTVTDGAQEDCLRHMRDNTHIPIGLKGANRLAERYWNDWRRGAIRRMNGVERAQERQREEARREQRRQERQQSGGGGNYDHCIDPGNSCLH